MIENAFGSMLLVVGLWTLVLQRLYSYIPLKELKRLATKGDPLAVQLYRPVAYGSSLRLVLWMVGAVAISGGITLLMQNLSVIPGIVLGMAVFALTLVVIPSLRLTKRSARSAALFSSLLTGVLLHTHSLLDRLVVLVNRYRSLVPHSRIYEKEDLLHLINRQKEQHDNRIDANDLEVVEKALLFAEKKAADILQPRTQTYLIDANDTIGPILLDQLHKQKQSSFLVFQESPDNIIGSLLMVDAVKAKHGGRVFELIKGELAFVHEDFSLVSVLKALRETGQQVAVVINSFQEFVGVVRLTDIIRELVGQKDTIDHMDFGSRQEVAAYEFKRPSTNADAVPAEEMVQENSPSQSAELA